MSLVEKQPKELQMTISSPKSPALVAHDQPSAGPDRPILRVNEFATVDDFFVDWHLGVAAGARR